MTPDRWARIKVIFGAALEKPPGERGAYLDSACGGDVALRGEAEKLLAESDEASLRSPAADLVTVTADLISGEMLAQYRIEAKLGEGGMGAVYRAYDTRLHRQVAVKVLLPDPLADPDRKPRLLREARAASALNHPNIVTIHEIGTARGQDFIAMEYVEGHPLSKILPSKGLPVAKALDYAVQIADALSQAHAAGVVHKDLKPANIMVNEAGRIKLLDFGLARRVRLPEGETGTLSVQGEIAGTPAYMSPEQAEGKKTDERTDIFAFGAVLYEMLSGYRAFQGESTLAVLGAVLREEPRPLTGVPRGLAHIVELCLRKDPAHRLQHIGDVRLHLEAITSEADGSQQAARPRKRPVLMVVSVLAAMLVISAVLWTVRFRNTQDRITSGQQVLPLTSYPGRESYPNFSPDGNQVVFSWDGASQNNVDIYVKMIDDVRPLRLTTNPAPDVSPVWSPDGRSIAFIRQDRPERSTLVLIPAIGGTERILLEDLTGLPNSYFSGRQLAWTPDGKWLAACRKSQSEARSHLCLVSRETGDTRRLTSPPKIPGCFDSSPAFSPDGRTLAFIRNSAFAVRDLYLAALGEDLLPMNEPARRTYLNGPISSPAWSSDGRFVVFAAGGAAFSNSLWKVRASGGGNPEHLAQAGYDCAAPALSTSGSRLAFEKQIADPDIWSLDLPGQPPLPGAVSRQPVRMISSTRSESNPQFSADGKRIAYESDISGRPGIWICNADGSNALELFAKSGVRSGTPRWSPSGGSLAFDSNMERQWDVYLVAERGGQPVRLTTNPADDYIPSWSRDGRWVYFCSNRSGSSQIWKMPVTAAGSDGSAIQVTRNGGHTAFESVDGRYVYYTKTAIKTGIWRIPVDGGEEKEVITSAVARNFAVAKSGIYYQSPPEPNKTSVICFHSFTTGRTNRIAQISGRPWIGFTVSPDGRSILHVQIEQAGSDLMLLEGFR
jgi:Tol biopolymer transport system component/predicted Ser/Thr protein kinase